MSLIHEALQKAESERRAGELPVLLGTRAVPTSRSQPQWHRYAFAASVVALVLALAYVNRDLIRSDLQDSEPTSPNESRRVDERRTEPTRREQRPTASARKPESVRNAPSSKPAEPPPMDAKTASQVDLISSHLGLSPASTAGVDAPAPTPEAQPIVSEPPPPPMPSPTPIPAMAKPIAEPVVAAPAPPIPAPPPAVTGTPSPTGRPPPTTDPSPIASVVPSTGSGEVLVYELPLEIRQNLPKLKVSMQAYHADPARRFAIIDGNRVNEHGMVGSEVTLLEIRRDGLLLEYRGTRFVLPRLGQ